MFGFVSALLVLSVISGVTWLIHRAFEEMNARMEHVCWIDDTYCDECGAFASSTAARNASS